MRTIAGRQHLLLQRHRNRVLTDAKAARRAVADGSMRRLRCGALVATAVWDALTPAERRRLEIAAAADAARDGLVMAHRSAATLWGAPLIRPHDGLVHIRTTIASGTRTEHGFRKHAVADLDQHVVQLQGIRLTSLARTIVDVALSEPFEDAVVAVDWALQREVERDELLTVLDEVAPKQGRARAERAIRFGDAASGSAGESRSRAQMEEGGLVIPVLQQVFRDEDGFIGVVDFWWPQFALIGEFDGLVKYTDADMLGDRTGWQALADEKRREDRLRTVNPKLTRWMWALLDSPGALVARLLALGVERRSTSGRF